MAEPVITVAPPRRNPRLGGLLDAVEVRQVEHIGAALNAQYVAEPCNFTFGDAGFCYGDLTPAEAGPKTYTGIEDNLSVVPNFAAFYGVQCYINDDSDIERRARDAFGLAESRHVEAKFAGWLNLASATAATDIVAAFGAAEEHADDNYIAQPVIHVNRATATAAVAADVVYADGTGKLWTAHGTPVVSSGKYGGDVWVTGAVTVLHSPLVVSGATAETTNREQAIVEGVYGIIVDCDYVARFDYTA